MTMLSNNARELLRKRHAQALGLAEDSPLLDMQAIERWAERIMADQLDLVSVLNGDALPYINNDGEVVVR